jgi:hypothetical protein
MNVTRQTVQPTLERLAVVLVPLVVLVVGIMWFVQPRFADTLRTQADLRGLEERVASLKVAASSGSAIEAADAAESVREFERRVATDDRTASLTEKLAHLALDPPDLDEARNLQIDAGARVQADNPGAVGEPRVGGASQTSIDPRFSLFPVSLQYTPITVTFEATYDRLGQFLWNLRDLPTLVEVRSLEVKRALPLIQIKLVLLAFQRSAPPAGPATGAPVKVAEQGTPGSRDAALAGTGVRP